MPQTALRPPCSWLTGLILIMVLAMAPQVWGQPGGMGKGGGMGGLMGGGGMGGPMDGEGGPGPGGGPKRKAPLRFDLTKATTITGQVESLGSYGMSSWRSLPGMAVQGLILKTEHGNIEVYVGPPSYVTKQKFTLQKGDTLKVKGFKVIRKDEAAFFAAEVKKDNQTLSLLDEQGSPLWKQQDAGGSDTQKPSRGGNDPSQVGGGMTGAGGMGRGR
jgi:hypothetical protein